jgi:glycine cleavage system transcriptional repressor
MPHVAVTAVGVDRPGIVAAVTGVLLEHGGNLEDTAMTRLGGHFAMVLVVEVTEDAAPLEEALVAATASLGLSVTVRAIGEEASPTETGAAWAVTVHGADTRGIVHRVASVLADEGANIVDLATRRITSDAGTGYVALLEVLLPASADTDRLARTMRTLAEELRVEIHLRPDEADFL